MKILLFISLLLISTLSFSQEKNKGCNLGSVRVKGIKTGPFSSEQPENYSVIVDSYFPGTIITWNFNIYEGDTVNLNYATDVYGLLFNKSYPIDVISGDTGIITTNIPNIEKEMVFTDSANIKIDLYYFQTLYVKINVLPSPEPRVISKAFLPKILQYSADIIQISTKSEVPVSVELYNLSGSRLKQWFKSGSFEVNMSEFPSGLYIFSFYTNGVRKSIKYIKP